MADRRLVVRPQRAIKLDNRTTTTAEMLDFAETAGFFQTRLDGRVVDCNMAAVRMLGDDSLVDAKTRNARMFYANPPERERILERPAHEAGGESARRRWPP